MAAADSWTVEQCGEMRMNLGRWRRAVDRQEAATAGRGDTREQWDGDVYLLVVALWCLTRGATAVLGSQHPLVIDTPQVLDDLDVVRDWVVHYDEFVLGEGRAHRRGLRAGLGMPWVNVHPIRGNDGPAVIAGRRLVELAEASAAAVVLYDAAMAVLLARIGP